MKIQPAPQTAICPFFFSTVTGKLAIHGHDVSGWGGLHTDARPCRPQILESIWTSDVRSRVGVSGCGHIIGILGFVRTEFRRPGYRRPGRFYTREQAGSLLFQRGERWLSGFDSRQSKGARINPTICGFDSRPGGKLPCSALVSADVEPIGN